MEHKLKLLMLKVRNYIYFAGQTYYISVLKATRFLPIVHITPNF